MRKIDHPANCVGVVTVKWSVQNDDTKTVYSPTLGSLAGLLAEQRCSKKAERNDSSQNQDTCRGR